MPELPDVESFRKYFDNNCIGKKVKHVEVRRSAILDSVAPEQFAAALVGNTFLKTERIGKNLLIETSGGVWLVLHFGMSGYLSFFKDAADEPPFLRVLFSFTDGTMLAYDNQRMIGKVGIVASPEEFVKKKGLGPDALSVSGDDYLRKMGAAKGKIKAVLMDQSIVAGVGNEYADEILFQAGLHPETRIERLQGKQLEGVFNIMRQVLDEAVAADADVKRMPPNFMLRTRRKNGKCPVCSSPFQLTKVGGRTTYFCPSCQRPEEGSTHPGDLFSDKH